MDAHADTYHERQGQLRTSGLYGRESTALAGDGERGRLDMGGLLGWEQPHSDVFRKMLNHPALVPALTDLMGVGGWPRFLDVPRRAPGGRCFLDV